MLCSARGEWQGARTQFWVTLILQSLGPLRTKPALALLHEI